MSCCYLLKDRVADSQALADAVRRIGGGSVLDPEVVSRMLGRSHGRDPLEELTPCGREVLGLMSEGRSNAAIAAELVVTDRGGWARNTSVQRPQVASPVLT
jgi:DNA-binding NarL/FixJ family response regulator